MSGRACVQLIHLIGDPEAIDVLRAVSNYAKADWLRSRATCYRNELAHGGLVDFTYGPRSGQQG